MPVTLLAILLVTGTELVLYAIGALPPAEPSTATLVTTARAVALLLFASAVSAGTLLTPPGKRLGIGSYISRALRFAQPGLLTALLIAAALFGVLIAELFLRLLIGEVSRAAALAAIAALLVFWMPAIPVSLVERRVPLSALRRAARLTRGARWQTLALLLAIFGIAALPALFIGLVVYGVPAEGTALPEPPLPPSIEFWIAALAGALLAGLAATVPPVVYTALLGRNEKGPS